MAIEDKREEAKDSNSGRPTSVNKIQADISSCIGEMRILIQLT